MTSMGSEPATIRIVACRNSPRYALRHGRRRNHATCHFYKKYIVPHNTYVVEVFFMFMTKFQTILTLKVLVTTIDAQWEGMGM